MKIDERISDRRSETHFVKLKCGLARMHKITKNAKYVVTGWHSLTGVT